MNKKTTSTATDAINISGDFFVVFFFFFFIAPFFFDIFLFRKGANGLCVCVRARARINQETQLRVTRERLAVSALASINNDRRG